MHIFISIYSSRYLSSLYFGRPPGVCPSVVVVVVGHIPLLVSWSWSPPVYQGHRATTSYLARDLPGLPGHRLPLLLEICGEV